MIPSRKECGPPFRFSRESGHAEGSRRLSARCQLQHIRSSPSKAHNRDRIRWFSCLALEGLSPNEKFEAA
jgi:hypothetical protein